MPLRLREQKAYPAGVKEIDQDTADNLLLQFGSQPAEAFSYA